MVAATRQAQKATVGIIVPQEDMPFTTGSLEEGGGMTPDVLFNPHGFPSRMTVALLLEMGLGKVALKTGKAGKADAFSKMTPERLQDVLEQAGFQRDGKQRFIDGRTGEHMDMDMYWGPVYYQRLHHFVENKAHARATGPRQIITRQPQEGRQRDGGLKTGEMEGQCFFSHGARAWLQDRLRDSSDLYECPVCITCGQIADPAAEDGTAPAQCRPCGTSESVRRVKLPYSWKMLTQQLMSMHIAPRFGLKEKVDA